MNCECGDIFCIRGRKCGRFAAAMPEPCTCGGAQRIARQKKVAEWCAAAFGVEHATSLPQRAVRLLEEAVELYQACEGDPAMAHKLIDYIFAKPAGTIEQELGGVGVTVLALAEAAGVSAEDAESAEVARVLSKPLEWFYQRNRAKNEAGFNVAHPKEKP